MADEFTPYTYGKHKIMEIFPENSAITYTQILGDTIQENIIGILGIMFVVLSVVFVIWLFKIALGGFSEKELRELKEERDREKADWYGVSVDDYRKGNF